MDNETVIGTYVSTADKFYLNNQMMTEPLQDCNFKLGDRVIFTNEYGVVFQPFTIIGFAKPENYVGKRFIHIDTDCPWMPVTAESLTLLPVI